jgi:hypothetical protein
MNKNFTIFIAFGIYSCMPSPKTDKGKKTGTLSGIIKNGNFSDKVLFEI